jgi:hypothetical protein
VAQEEGVIKRGPQACTWMGGALKHDFQAFHLADRIIPLPGSEGSPLKLSNRITGTGGNIDRQSESSLDWPLVEDEETSRSVSGARARYRNIKKNGMRTRR